MRRPTLSVVRVSFVADSLSSVSLSRLQAPSFPFSGGSTNDTTRSVPSRWRSKRTALEGRRSSSPAPLPLSLPLAPPHSLFPRHGLLSPRSHRAHGPPQLPLPHARLPLAHRPKSRELLLRTLVLRSSLSGVEVAWGEFLFVLLQQETKCLSRQVLTLVAARPPSPSRVRRCSTRLGALSPFFFLGRDLSR